MRTALLVLLLPLAAIAQPATFVGQAVHNPGICPLEPAKAEVAIRALPPSTEMAALETRVKHLEAQAAFDRMSVRLVLEAAGILVNRIEKLEADVAALTGAKGASK